MIGVLLLTFVCSLLLALFSEGLKPKSLFNKELDKKKNILQIIDTFLSTEFEGGRHKNRRDKIDF